MKSKANKAHDQEISRFCRVLKSNGYAVIPLMEKSPDAIAFKDGDFYAVEIVKDGNAHHRTIKRLEYHQFKGILFSSYSTGKTRVHKYKRGNGND